MRNPAPQRLHDHPAVGVSYESFIEDVQVGDSIFVDGGMSIFEVQSKAGPEVQARCIDAGRHSQHGLVGILPGMCASVSPCPSRCKRYDLHVELMMEECFWAEKLCLSPGSGLSAVTGCPVSWPGNNMRQ